MRTSQALMRGIPDLAVVAAKAPEAGMTARSLPSSATRSQRRLTALTGDDAAYNLNERRDPALENESNGELLQNCYGAQRSTALLGRGEKLRHREVVFVKLLEDCMNADQGMFND